MELKIGDKVIVKEHNVFAKEIKNGDEGTIIEKGANIILLKAKKGGKSGIKILL